MDVLKIIAGIIGLLAFDVMSGVLFWLMKGRKTSLGTEVFDHEIRNFISGLVFVCIIGYALITTGLIDKIV